jgi:hypothetical protein
MTMNWRKYGNGRGLILDKHIAFLSGRMEEKNEYVCHYALSLPGF